jgi:hypothetical protein
LKNALKLLKLYPNDFNIHSFRIGAATSFSVLGKSDDEIKKLTTFKPFLSKPRFFPVGLWVVCFSAFAMIDDPIIHIFLLNRPEIFHYLML